MGLKHKWKGVQEIIHKDSINKKTLIRASFKGLAIELAIFLMLMY